MRNYQDWVDHNAADLLKGNNRSLVDTWRSSWRDFEAKSSQNTQHIMLLTTDEAADVMKSLYNKGTTYAGNIKDTVSGTKNLSKLVTYKDAGKLVLNLNGLGIKAEQYIHKGAVYIKITGYPSLRRILNGTRYKINHPKILELGLGKMGINAGIVSSARFCIYFAAAQRVVEYVFSTEHEVAAFIGNLTMDLAKIIVTIFVTKALSASVGGATAMFGIVVPVSVSLVAIVTVGFLITFALLTLDNKYHLSENAMKSINDGLHEYQRIMEWKIKYSNQFLYSMINGCY